MLTDTTLCAPGCAGGEALLALYDALLELDVLVQVPPATAQALGSALAPECTVLEPTDAPHLTLDGALLLGDYEAAFAAAPREATLNARGHTALCTALSVEWVLQTGRGCTASLLGCDGGAALEQMLLALHLNGIPQRTTALAGLGRAWARCFGRGIPAHQPGVGAGIFEVASGVHVDGLRKNPASYDPFPPEAVGARQSVVLGKHAGRSAVALRLEQLGLSASGFDMGTLAARVRALGERLGRVDDGMLLELAWPLRREHSA